MNPDRPEVTARAELALASAHLVLMERARRREALVRERQAANAWAEISRRRMQSEEAAPAAGIHGSGSRSPLMVSLIVIIALAAIAGLLCVRYAGRGHSSAVARPAEVSAEAGSAETHALSRLGAAVGTGPSQAVLRAANRWLDDSGQKACSVGSAEGGASLVISGDSGDKPLLAALSRCAQALEAQK